MSHEREFTGMTPPPAPPPPPPGSEEENAFPAINHATLFPAQDADDEAPPGEAQGGSANGGEAEPAAKAGADGSEAAAAAVGEAMGKLRTDPASVDHLLLPFVNKVRCLACVCVFAC